MENWIINLMERFGYLGTFLLIMIENIFPPIPSEVILTFSGFMTTTTEMTVLGVILYATAGSVAGAVILYGIGQIFNIEMLEKIINRWGHILRIKVSDIEKADSWFQKYGYRTIFFCRMIPLIRSLISIPAGMANMKFNLFLFYTTLGTFIWNTLLIFAGAVLGESWSTILNYMDVYSHITYAILGVLCIIIVCLWYFKRSRKIS